MRLSRRALDVYNAAVKKCGNEGQRAALSALDAWFGQRPDATVAETREFCISMLRRVGTEYGEKAGDAAYAMRAIVADAMGVELPETDYAYEPDPEHVGDVPRYQVEKLKAGDVDGFKRAIANAARYFSERGANDTMAALGRRDAKKLGSKVRFARIPTGATTCPYCCMLASRGFVYSSELAALNANHRNCDCRIVEGFAGMEVEGYDPDRYYDMWKHPEKYVGSTTESAVEDIGTQPVRPKRSDYADDAEYQAAREKYRSDRDDFARRKAELVSELESSSPGKFTDRQAVKTWANTRGIAVDPSVLDKVDSRTIDEIVTTTDRLLDKYPIVMEDKRASGGGYAIRFGDPAESYFMEASGGLNLNPTWFDSRRKTVEFVVDRYTDESYNEGVERNLRGMVRGDGTYGSAVTHEFGHNVDEAIRWKRFYSGDDIDHDGLNRYKSELIDLTKDYTVSEYALTNVDEAFAEGFAEMECNPSSEYAKAFSDFLKRWM